MKVLENPAKFQSNFLFEITFECIAPGIDSELEWKLIYVGSADDERNDQELDSVLVGPVSIGVNKFLFQAPPPDPSKIPAKDLLEVTVILLTCHYKDQEFVRIGYYVNNDYGDREDLRLNPPSPPSIQDICRNILDDKPRVTRFQIRWTDDAPLLGGSEAMAGAAESAGTVLGGFSHSHRIEKETSNPPPSPLVHAEVDGAEDLEMSNEEEGDDEEEEDDDDDRSVDLEEEPGEGGESAGLASASDREPNSQIPDVQMNEES